MTTRIMVILDLAQTVGGVAHTQRLKPKLRKNPTAHSLGIWLKVVKKLEEFAHKDAFMITVSHVSRVSLGTTQATRMKRTGVVLELLTLQGDYIGNVFVDAELRPAAHPTNAA